MTRYACPLPRALNHTWLKLLMFSLTNGIGQIQSLDGGSADFVQHVSFLCAEPLLHCLPFR